MQPESRVLNLTTHAFDVYIYNTGGTLAHGGCLCIPTKAQVDDDLTQCIRSMKATYIDVTPSIARLIRPEMIPLLTTIVLGGEPSTTHDMERWWGYAMALHAYGPSECTTNSVINYNARDPSAAIQIGKGAGAVTWVVSPADHNILMPIGAIGELLLEGPLLGNGYLKDPA